jgi:hypothetical protein
MSVESEARDPKGPICPNCREPLRENLRHERIDAQGRSEHGPSPVEFVYCGSCGWLLQSERVGARSMVEVGRRGAEVAAPADETTLEGQFHLRCGGLIVEIRALGFDPFVWVGLINDLGAVRAAKAILSQYGVLPVTEWLVDRDRPELTLEREIEQIRWADLFDDAERSLAARRIASVTRHDPDR